MQDHSALHAPVNKTLNCIGLYCPEPVIKTREMLNEMQVNEVLEVIANDPAAEADIKSLVKHLQEEILSIKKNGNVTTIIIKKTK